MSGMDLHFEEKGEGRPLIFLHGFGANIHTWKHLIPRLADQYKTVSLDLKGFGRSPKPADNEYSAEDQAELVADFIVNKDLSDITLIGHSLGGAIGLLTAVKLQARGRKSPHSLVLIDTIAYKQPLPLFIKLLRLPMFGRLLMDVVSEEIQVEVMLRYLYHDKTKITKETIAQYAAPLKEPGAKTALIKTAKLIIPPHIEKIVPSYRSIYSPTLIIWGQYDRIVSLRIGSRLAGELPNAKLIPPLPAGHAPHEEVPGLVMPEILNFLERIDR